jgi:hypothetical protein
MMRNATESVRLEGVTARRDGVAGGHRGVHLFAQLYLGELTPADIVVIVAPDCQRLSSADEHRVAERRMASFQSYQNGTYVFEAWLPPDALDSPREWLIQVRFRSSDPSGHRTILRERIAPWRNDGRRDIAEIMAVEV